MSSFDDSYLHLISYDCPGHECTEQCWDGTWYNTHSTLIVPRTCKIQFEAHSVEKNRKFRLGSECAICLEPIFIQGFVLGCAHAYHAKCLFSWIETRSAKGMWGNCPVCRKPNDCFTPLMIQESILHPEFDELESIMAHCIAPKLQINLKNDLLG